MKILFEWETFREDDHSWEALFVKIDEGNWHLAKPHYGTEDENKIKEILNGN